MEAGTNQWHYFKQESSKMVATEYEMGTASMEEDRWTKQIRLAMPTLHSRNNSLGTLGPGRVTGAALGGAARQLTAPGGAGGAVCLR